MFNLPDPNVHRFCVVVLSGTVRSYHPESTWKAACDRAYSLSKNCKRPSYVSIRVSDKGLWFWASNRSGQAIKLSGRLSK